jgi:hypothetical protein
MEPPPSALITIKIPRLEQSFSAILQCVLSLLIFLGSVHFNSYAINTINAHGFAASEQEPRLPWLCPRGSLVQGLRQAL